MVVAEFQEGQQRRSIFSTASRHEVYATGKITCGEKAWAEQRVELWEKNEWSTDVEVTHSVTTADGTFGIKAVNNILLHRPRYYIKLVHECNVVAPCKQENQYFIPAEYLHGQTFELKDVDLMMKPEGAQDKVKPVC
ncbi:unnamed protein product, partial [Mesorhabditis spiculigera]